MVSGGCHLYGFGLVQSRRVRADQGSRDRTSPWSSLVEFERTREVATDSRTGRALVEFERTREVATDSPWSSLVEFERTGMNDPPEWDLPAAINVAVDDDDHRGPK